MTIAITLSEYLDRHHVNYDVVSHRFTQSSLDSSRSAHVPANKLGKAVILQNSKGKHLMASLPGDYRLSLMRLNHKLQNDYHLISEVLLKDLFPDCAQGAIPSIGDAYKMNMMIDDALLKADAVYIEAGDHTNLIKIERAQYQDMMSDIPHADICGTSIGMPRTI